MAKRNPAKRNPKAGWDDDPSSAKNTFKRGNERGRQTAETEFRSNVFPRSKKAPRGFVQSLQPQTSYIRKIDIGNNNSMTQTETSQRRIQRIGTQMGNATRYSRVTGGGSTPGHSLGQGGRVGGGSWRGTK
jgi:hypothetical protein